LVLNANWRAAPATPRICSLLLPLLLWAFRSFCFRRCALQIEHSLAATPRLQSAAAAATKHLADAPMHCCASCNMCWVGPGRTTLGALCSCVCTTPPKSETQFSHVESTLWPVRDSQLAFVQPLCVASHLTTTVPYGLLTAAAQPMSTDPGITTPVQQPQNAAGCHTVLQLVGKKAAVHPL
jgi:hypothetical protein